MGTALRLHQWWAVVKTDVAKRGLSDADFVTRNKTDGLPDIKTRHGRWIENGPDTAELFYDKRGDIAPSFTAVEQTSLACRVIGPARLPLLQA